ncbi:MAG: flagellar biosynthesis protein FlgD [Candidatus Zixiibacteriota bacterium]|nr:MAG: flagellar biosynthesis protein FlgD [candidate division Zixibacteria bacterium]
MGFISPVGSDAQGNPRATGSMQSLGKDDFLQLLVTKLQNQDPLKPMEDEDFVAQLAQFSSLEQMYNIAEGIASSNEWDFLQMQSINNVMASGLIGKDVKATYEGVYVDQDNAPQITYTMSSPADEVTFVITDMSGNTVATVTQDNVDAGVNTFTWEGCDSAGNRVDQGYYLVEATATTSSGATIKPSLSLAGRVEAIVYREGAAYLRVNGTEVALGDVSAIGEPGTYTGETDQPES